METLFALRGSTPIRISRESYEHFKEDALSIKSGTARLTQTLMLRIFLL